MTGVFRQDSRVGAERGGEPPGRMLPQAFLSGDGAMRHAPSTPRPSLLIYGSHFASIEGLKQILEGYGQPVILSTLFADVVLEQVRSRRVDIVVFDLYHRSKAEFELASTIRRLSKNTQILFLIDEPTLDELRLAVRHGVIGFLRKKSRKPFHLADIIIHIARSEAVIEASLLTQFLQSLPGTQSGLTSGEQEALQQLSPLDKDILRRVAAGDTSKQIAGDCGFSAGFIRNRLTVIYQTLGVTNKAQAVGLAVRSGMIQP